MAGVEETIERILDLPPGKEWAWFADANVLGLSRHLDAAGRDRVRAEAQEAWRHRYLRRAV